MLLFKHKTVFLYYTIILIYPYEIPIHAIVVYGQFWCIRTILPLPHFRVAF
jgi:hypothetical protein